MNKLCVPAIVFSLLLPLTLLHAQDTEEQTQQENVKTYTTPDGKTVTVTVQGNRTITVTTEEGKTTTVETVNGKVVRTTTATTRSSGKQTNEETKNEEDDSIILAKIGYGVNKWNISPLQRKIKGDKSSYDYTSEAFYTKRFDLELRLFFLKGGLEYLTNNLREWGGFNRDDAKMQSQSQSQAQDSKLRQFDIFGGLKIFDTTIKTEILLRQFSNTLISRGVQDTYSGTGMLPIHYFNKDGKSIDLQRGDCLQWNSLYQQYDIKMVTQHNKYIITEMGIQYAIYDAPTEYSITYTRTTYSGIPLPLLVHTTLYSYNFVFGARIRSYFNDYVYLQMFMPATLGASKFENPLFKTKYGYSFASSANISLNFATGFTHLEAGVEGRFVTMYAFSVSKTSTKQDIDVQLSNGNSEHLDKGTKLSYISMRDDLFYGAFVKAGVFF
jgi:hypothetical protein